MPAIQIDKGFSQTDKVYTQAILVKYDPLRSKRGSTRRVNTWPSQSNEGIDYANKERANTQPTQDFP